jgi:hypothetical protein
VQAPALKHPDEPSSRMCNARPAFSFLARCAGTVIRVCQIAAYIENPLSFPGT